MTQRRKSRRGGARFGNPSGLRGRPSKAPPGTQHIRLEAAYALPCSIRKPTASDPDAICGKPATAAVAWLQEPAGEWPTPGLWTLQPICRECAEAAAKVYGVEP